MEVASAAGDWGPGSSVVPAGRGGAVYGFATVNVGSPRAGSLNVAELIVVPGVIAGPAAAVAAAATL